MSNLFSNRDVFDWLQFIVATALAMYAIILSHGKKVQKHVLMVRQAAVSTGRICVPAFYAILAGIIWVLMTLFKYIHPISAAMYTSMLAYRVYFSPWPLEKPDLVHIIIPMVFLSYALFLWNHKRTSDEIRQVCELIGKHQATTTRMIELSKRQ